MLVYFHGSDQPRIDNKGVWHQVKLGKRKNNGMWLIVVITKVKGESKTFLSGFVVVRYMGEVVVNRWTAKQQKEWIRVFTKLPDPEA